MRDLTQEERQVLAELEICSNGTTNGYEPVATKSGSSSTIPPAADGPHLRWRRTFTAATIDAVPVLLEQARSELRSITRRVGAVPCGESTDERADRIRDKLAQGWSIGEVSAAIGVTETEVRQARKPTTNTEIRRLAEEGRSVRSIAMMIGVPKSTVHRVLSTQKAA